MGFMYQCWQQAWYSGSILNYNRCGNIKSTYPGRCFMPFEAFMCSLRRRRLQPCWSRFCWRTQSVVQTPIGVLCSSALLDTPTISMGDIGLGKFRFLVSTRWILTRSAISWFEAFTYKGAPFWPHARSLVGSYVHVKIGWLAWSGSYCTLYWSNTLLTSRIEDLDARHLWWNVSLKTVSWSPGQPFVYHRLWFLVLVCLIRRSTENRI